MDIHTHLVETYGITLDAKGPIEIRNTNRVTLARLFHTWGFTRGVEVGVERGAYTKILCESNPGVEIYGVDPWTAHRGYRDHVNQEKLDRFYAETRTRLAPYPGVTLVKKFSVDAAKDFENGSLDFVYIDANHNLQSVIADLAAWSPKVRDGGVLAGHDYVAYHPLHRGHDGEAVFWPNQIHVVHAVKAWTAAYEIRPWFVLGAQAKEPGVLRDDHRSWFWVHQNRPSPRPGQVIKQ